jgi:hypothetical protein
MKTPAIRLAAALLVAFVATAAPAAQPPVPEPPTPTADDLFDPNTLHEIRLEVNTRDWAELQQRYRENVYYLATLRWRDQVARNIGIRSRGAASRNPAKPGLRLDFDRYALDQEFLGLKSVVLDNLTQDPSMLKERVIMRFFNEMGIPAPRVVNARLFVNNELIGLYAIVESVDKHFLKRNFNENDGYLYEFHHSDVYQFEYLGDELEKYAEFFEPKTHEHDSMAALYRPIREMTWAIGESPDGLFVSAAGEYLDLPTVLTHVAVENFLASYDGLLGAWGMNNFYLYRFENRTLSQLVPWDEDSSFWGIDYNIRGNAEANVLTRRALQDRALESVYLAALRRCAELALRRPEPAPGDSRNIEPAPVLPGWLEREVAFVYAQIRDAALEDHEKPFTNEQFEDEVSGVLAFSRERPGYVLSEADKTR